MNRLLHKLRVYGKKSSLTVLLVALGWFVYAGDFKDDFTDTQVKVVKFYPNPATSYINFEFPENIDKTYTLDIYSFTGRKIIELPVSGNRISLTLSNEFYRGIYVFHLLDRTGKVVDFGKFQVIR